MLTPAQLQQYEFKSAGRNAYRADDVDSFFGEVLVSYEKLYRENGELIKRMSLLADRLEKFKNDETDIKQAVLSAQKAADMITKDAEATASQTKEEAENILAAAKGEAAIIKSDAEKQAIADSELLLSMARDKAEEIMKKAKEKAHGILIAANDSASNTVGAANRTITSESIHYDMLKKEVSEFRASILAQYKAHIELISKLPEMAIEEASKIDVATPPVADVSVDNLENKLEEVAADEEDSIIDFSDTDDLNLDETVENETENESVEEEVSDAPEASAEISPAETTAVFDLNEQPADETDVDDIPVSKKFTINTDDLIFDGFDDDFSENENTDDIAYDEAVEEVNENNSDADVDIETLSEESIVDEAASEDVAFSVELDDDEGPDVILSFDDSVVEDDVDEASDSAIELTLDDFSDSDESVEEEKTEDVPTESFSDAEDTYEDIFSNSDTNDLDDLILAFDDEEVKQDEIIEESPVRNTEESAQSKRARYARMFGDDYEEDDGADDSISSFFGSIETISVDDFDSDKPEKKSKVGFFKRKK
ncbi:MAG: DivIVA domain-containing protein [Clostridia bacterium]|nr:DivIVA domain-containing protein [Clostridia bacterium]